MKKTSFGFLFIFFLLLVSCTKKDFVYDPSYLQENAKKNFPVKNIDQNQDWNMIASFTVSAKLNQQTNEKYTVRVFSSNPFNKELDARLLAEKENVNDGTSVDMTFDAPKSLNSVYVMIEDSKYNRSLRTAEISNSAASVAWNSSSSSSRSGNIMPRSSIDSRSIVLPAMNFPTTIPSGAKQYSSGNLNPNDTYYLDGSTTPLTNVSINWNLNGIKLYIKGDVTFANNQFPTKYEIYILPYSKVSMPSGLTLDQGALITVGENAELNLGMDCSIPGNIYSKGKIVCSNSKLTIKNLFYQGGELNCKYLALENGKLYNDGVISASNLEMNNSGETENNGTVNVGYLYLTGASMINEGVVKATSVKLDSNGALQNQSAAQLQIDGDLDIQNTIPFINSGELTAKTLKTTSGAQIINKCKMKILESASLEQANITIDGGCYIYFKSIVWFNNTKINLGEKSLFVIDSGLSGKWGGRNELNGPTENGDRALFYVNGDLQEDGWKLLIMSGNIDRTSTKDLPNTDFTELNNAGSVDFNNVSLGAEGTCSRSFNTKSGGVPFEPVSECYTFAFEDMFKEAGDYDFNDVVVKVDAVPQGGKIKAQLVAAGASKSLIVHCKVRGVTKTIFNNEEVHKAFGVEEGAMINTGYATATPVISYIDVPADYNPMKDLDIYITGAESSVEVHIPHFTQTFQTGDVPYALLVPTDWSYPSEKQSVIIKYPKFVQWAQDAKTELDWYK